jgi:hypothetical protein
MKQRAKKRSEVKAELQRRDQEFKQEMRKWMRDQFAQIVAIGRSQPSEAELLREPTREESEIQKSLHNSIQRALAFEQGRELPRHRLSNSSNEVEGSFAAARARLLRGLQKLR